MREGHVYRRCRKCSRALPKGARRCACGGERFTWTIRVDAHRAGERRRLIVRADPSWREADARDALNRLQASLRDGTHVETSRQTVADYLGRRLPDGSAEGWLAGERGRVRPGSWANYESTIRRHVAPALGAIRLQALQPVRVRQLYADLEASGLSVKSTHNVHVMLRRALADAVRDGLVARNPADRAHSLPRGRNRAQVRVWDPTQTSSFLASVRADRLFALWRLATTSGLRRGELLALTWTDVDLDAGSVSVSKARVRGVGEWVTNDPKTAAGRRLVEPDRETMAALREHRRAQLQERIAYGPGWTDGDLVFCRADGTPLDPDGITGAFERLARAVGLPRIRFHDLRHGAASLMLAAGVPAKVVQEQLGHSSIAVTMDLYSHLMPGMKRDASERLAALINAAAAAS